MEQLNLVRVFLIRGFDIKTARWCRMGSCYGFIWNIRCFIRCFLGTISSQFQYNRISFWGPRHEVLYCLQTCLRVQSFKHAMFKFSFAKHAMFKFRTNFWVLDGVDCRWSFNRHLCLNTPLLRLCVQLWDSASTGKFCASGAIRKSDAQLKTNLRTW